MPEPDIICGDCLDVMVGMPDKAFDLVITSPPYAGGARWYGNLKFKLDGQEYVDWCVDRFLECLRVTDGPVCWVIQGKTKRFRWDATPCLLVADLHRRGVNLRCPKIFNRVGIPGSGGPDWFRNDWELIVCATPPGKLKWSDNTACGHPPKWAPGGAMANRLASGARVNQWGAHVDADGFVSKGGQDGASGKRAACVPLRPSHIVVNGRDQWGGTPTTTSGSGRKANGQPKNRKRLGQGTCNGVAGSPKGSTQYALGPENYAPPVLANPGNVLQQEYTAQAVADLIEQSESGLDVSDILDLIVGGGVMGSKLAHENEAPFPLKLVERFVLSLCPPGGRVLDPFGGSGTVLQAAILHGRHGTAIDAREDQCELMRKRVEEAQAQLQKGTA